MTDDETLPFDVEVERYPLWAHAASGAVVVVGVLVAIGIAPMLAFLPFLLVSAMGRRFATTAMHVEVGPKTLTLGNREVSRERVLDVWHDRDESEARVLVAVRRDAGGADLVVMYFENREQARRFARSFDDVPAVVAGHAPRAIDLLPSLRFAALAVAFFGTQSWFGVLALLFFALGAYAWARAKQVVVTAEGVEVRTAFGSSTYRWEDVDAVDRDAAVVRMRGGSEMALPRAAIRDVTLSAPAWLDGARTRVLRRIADAAARAKGGSEPSSD